MLREKENELNGLPFNSFVVQRFKAEIHMFFCATLLNTDELRKAGGFKDEYDRYVDVSAEFQCDKIYHTNANQALYLNQIKAKLKNTSETWISAMLFILNIYALATKFDVTF